MWLELILLLLLLLGYAVVSIEERLRELVRIGQELTELTQRMQATLTQDA